MTPTPARRAHELRVSPTTRHLAMALLGVGVALPGCSPDAIQRRSEDEIRQATLATVRRQLAEAEARAEPRRLERVDETGRLEIKPEQLDEIQREYAVPGYLERLRQKTPDGLDPIEVLMGENLYGEEHAVVPVSLHRAVSAAVEHNLDVEYARYQPAIAEADVTSAEAAFDWVFGGGVTWEDTDTPQRGPGFLGLGIQKSSSQVVSSSVGVSRSLTTGGTVGLTQNLSYTDERSSSFGSVSQPDPSSTVSFDVELSQPLLRGFGSDVNLAEVRLAQNAERGAIADLRSSLIESVTDVEDAYWTLVLRYNELVVQARLLERGEEVRDNIKARRVLDARQAEVADAVARSERRRGNVLRARTNLRRASDRLKSLINDPSLPVGGEALLVPADVPTDAPFEFSLAELVAAAVQSRPEIERAILAIDDASIRQVVARNAALPRLDLQARLTLIGLDEDTASAYDRVFETEFIDGFLLGFEFEQAIGNRAGEAGERRARLERMRSVVGFRRTVQGVVLEVKDALDQVALNHELIEQARLSRVAQAEALRTLLVEKEFGDAGYSVTRLDLELTQQEALATAEISEVSALIDYHRALAELHRATGESLERNRIDFVVPDMNQIEPGARALDYRPAPEE